MIAQLLNVLAPVFISIGLGWGWVKMGRAYETKFISSMVMTIGAPCLVFSTLTSLTIPFHTVGLMGSAFLAVIVLSGGIGWLILRVIGLGERAFLPPVMFANIGNMGVPLCFFAFGKPGLALAVVGVAVYSVLTLSVGAWLFSGEANVAGLLESLSLEPRRVAVERNRRLVPRARFAETPLAENDELEIVTLVGGG